MKKKVIGYIYDHTKLNTEDKKFLKIAKRLHVELVLFNISAVLSEDEIEEKARRCKTILNNSGTALSNELIKTLYSIGAKVIENPSVSIYPEDKWLFFLSCIKNNIPTPKTILLPENIPSIKRALKQFSSWPVIIKWVYGERGRYVFLAKDTEDAVRIVKKLWSDAKERIPIIAQERVKSNVYRVTIIDGKIVQTAVKHNCGWKATGCYANSFKKFKIEPSLRKMILKVYRLSKIKICGIDLLKKDDSWLFLELNAEPSLRMFTEEHDKMIEAVLRCIKKLH